MSELLPVSPSDIIASDHINDIADRSLQRYASAAERDSLNPTPTAGEQAYIVNAGVWEVFNGSIWVDTMPNLFSTSTFHSAADGTGRVSQNGQTVTVTFSTNAAIGSAFANPIPAGQRIDTGTLFIGGSILNDSNIEAGSSQWRIEPSGNVIFRGADSGYIAGSWIATGYATYVIGTAGV